MSVRVRYAPSPTGSPHVGNIRTALYNHLFAQKEKGTMILRIEDTDRSRYKPESEVDTLESLKYVGVEWQEGLGVGGDSGPYRQSERKEAGIYQPFIDKLVADGAAYWAFDTSEELDEMRLFQQVNKRPTGYFGGEWRDAPMSKVEEKWAAGEKGVLRLRIPRGERIVVEDAIRGRTEFESDTVDDPVIIKGDGMPTYHFAAMVDDHLMAITHIFRGEEWISSAPKHIVLWKAIGATPPVLVHLPVIKGKDGKKLSKRHGDTACLDFRRAGYLGDALANFIALIGWAPGEDREIMSMDEMIDAFRIGGIQPSSGIFDIDKLNWLNGSRLRSQTVAELKTRFEEYAANPDNHTYWEEKAAEEEAKPEDKLVLPAVKALAEVCSSEPEYALQIMELERERVSSLADFGPKCAFFLSDVPLMEEKALAKWRGQPHAEPMLAAMAVAVETMDEVTVEACEALVRSQAEVYGFDKLGPVVHPVRLALTGQTVGPGLWELMAALGRDRLIKRLKANGVLFA